MVRCGLRLARCDIETSHETVRMLRRGKIYAARGTLTNSRQFVTTLSTYKYEYICVGVDIAMTRIVS